MSRLLTILLIKCVQKSSRDEKTYLFSYVHYMDIPHFQIGYYINMLPLIIITLNNLNYEFIILTCFFIGITI